jgi:hypothetical protein
VEKCYNTNETNMSLWMTETLNAWMVSLLQEHVFIESNFGDACSSTIERTLVCVYDWMFLSCNVNKTCKRIFYSKDHCNTIKRDRVLFMWTFASIGSVLISDLERDVHCTNNFNVNIEDISTSKAIWKKNWKLTVLLKCESCYMWKS